MCAHLLQSSGFPMRNLLRVPFLAAHHVPEVHLVWMGSSCSLLTFTTVWFSTVCSYLRFLTPFALEGQSLFIALLPPARRCLSQGIPSQGAPQITFGSFRLLCIPATVPVVRLVILGGGLMEGRGYPICFNLCFLLDESP